MFVSRKSCCIQYYRLLKYQSNDMVKIRNLKIKNPRKSLGSISLVCSTGSTWTWRTWPTAAPSPREGRRSGTSPGRGTGEPVTHSRVFLVCTCKKWLVQCKLQDTRTLDKSLFTRYQRNTAIFIWSGCKKQNYFKLNSFLEPIQYIYYSYTKRQNFVV